MADGTLQILGSGTSAAPLTVNVTGSQSLDPVAIKATFDGTASGTDFVPVVELISDAGVVMAQAKGQTVTAGGSATVTFFPFGDEETATGGGVTSITSADGSIVVTNPGGPITDLAGFKPQTTYEFLSSNSMTVTNANAGTFTWTHANGSTLLDLTVPAAPLVKVSGMWAAVATTRVTANFTAGGYATCDMAMGDGGVSNQTARMFLPNAGPTTTESYGQTMVHYMSGTARISLSVFNNDGAASRTFVSSLYVVRIT
jgi:hypothetical protein